MSNETDLDWLARNVHVWPDIVPGRAFAAAFVSDGASEWIEYSPVDWSGCYHKHQWLARRAKLQNKPSWEAAPEWAGWLAKDSPDKDGESAWWWYADKPVDMKNTWQVSTEGRAMMASSCHCDLGDWRDMLERRPADLSEPAVTQRLDEAAKNVLAAVPDLLGDQFKFEHNTKPVTVSNETAQLADPVVVAGTGDATASAFLIGRVVDLLRTSTDYFSAEEIADLHQLCDAELTKRDAAVCGGQKYLNAHWFERGELPQVGTVCEYTLGANAPWYQCEIKYVIRGDGVVMKRIPCGDEQYCGLHHKHPVSFRPIRTDRELAIEDMMKTINVIDFVGTPHHLVSEISAIMYDAGYRKDPK